MLDAHKHLGADKGVSMTMGTPGTLSHLDGHVRVGAAPCRGELIRAIADLSLVGVDGYYEKYQALVAAIDLVLKQLQDSGMTIVNGQHRCKGSTVFAIEDPSAVVGKKLKQRGHSLSPIYALEPSEPDRCQTGWQLSLTPHCLRELDGRAALDIFAADAVECYTVAKASRPAFARHFAENSLAAFLITGGNEEFFTFEQLRQPGVGRDVTSLAIRRLYSAILDSGVARSNRQSAPLKEAVRKGSSFVILPLLAMMMLRRARSKL